MALQPTLAGAAIRASYALFCILLLTTTAANEQNVRLETINGMLVVHMPKGSAFQVQFHENGIFDGPPQTVAFQQDLEDMKLALRKELLGEMAAIVDNIGSLNASLSQSLLEENQNRIEADNDLSAALLVESKDRTDADVALGAALLAESKDRIKADTALDVALRAESKDRTDATKALSASVLSERKDRAKADTTLDVALDAESKARIKNDTSLSTTLKPLESINLNSLLRRLVRLPNPGRNRRAYYAWPALFDKLFRDGKSAGKKVFDDGATYLLLITSSNGVHSHTYKMDLRIGGTSYGGIGNRYAISNIQSVNGPWHGGCGSTPFSPPPTSSTLAVLGNACNEAVDLFVTKVGG